MTILRHGFVKIHKDRKSLSDFLSYYYDRNLANYSFVNEISPSVVNRFCSFFFSLKTNFYIAQLDYKFDTSGALTTDIYLLSIVTLVELSFFYENYHKLC